MVPQDIESSLHALTNSLVEELISIAPASMREVEFEIVATEDGGADFGLQENHPDATTVALSDAVYEHVSLYLTLVRQYMPDWKRSLIVFRESEGGWEISVKFEQG